MRRVHGGAVIDCPEDVKLEWLSRVAAEMLAQDKPEAREALERIFREVCEQLMRLMSKS